MGDFCDHKEGDGKIHDQGGGIHKIHADFFAHYRQKLGKARGDSEKYCRSTGEGIEIGGEIIFLAQKGLRLIEEKYQKRDHKEKLPDIKGFIHKAGNIAIFHHHSHGAPKGGHEGKKGHGLSLKGGIGKCEKKEKHTT